MEEFGKLEERVVLVGVQTDDHDNVEESLDELKELASTAGAVTVGRIIQNRESVHWYMLWMQPELSVMTNFLLHS